MKTFAVLAFLVGLLTLALQGASLRQAQSFSESEREQRSLQMRASLLKAVAVLTPAEQAAPRFAMAPSGEPYIPASRATWALQQDMGVELAARGLKVSACSYVFHTGSYASALYATVVDASLPWTAVAAVAIVSPAADTIDCPVLDAQGQIAGALGRDWIVASISRLDVLRGPTFGTGHGSPVGSKSVLTSLPSPQPGETHLVLDEGLVYRFKPATSTWTVAVFPLPPVVVEPITSYANRLRPRGGWLTVASLTGTSTGDGTTVPSFTAMRAEAYFPEMGRDNASSTFLRGDAPAGVRTDGAAAMPTVATWQQAMAACESLSPTSRLISLREWQSLAIQTAGVAANWTGGSVGSGVLKQGLDGTVQADTPTTDCVRTGTVTACGSGSSGNSTAARSRVLSLPGGETIIDFAGNLAEWVSPTDARITSQDVLPTLPDFQYGPSSTYATTLGYTVGTKVCTYANSNVNLVCSTTDAKRIPSMLRKPSAWPLTDAASTGLGVYGYQLGGHVAITGAANSLDKGMLVAGGGVTYSGSAFLAMKNPGHRGVMHYDMVRAENQTAPVYAGFRCVDSLR